MYSHRALDEKKQFISRNEHKGKTHMERVQNCCFSLSICKFVTLFSSSRRSCLRKHKSTNIKAQNYSKEVTVTSDFAKATCVHAYVAFEKPLCTRGHLSFD